MVELDQTNPAAIRPAAERVAQDLGRPDILVNDAAWNISIPFPNLDALTTEIWDRIFTTNVRGPFQLAQAAVPHMHRQGAGRIVNIASVAELRPGGSSIAYASSKAALIHLTRCLALALAPDIAVNCVAPGLIEGTATARRLPKEIAQGARQMAVLGRPAGREDIADQVVTSCRADSVTGQMLNVDAGIHFQWDQRPDPSGAEGKRPNPSSDTRRHREPGPCSRLRSRQNRSMSTRHSRPTGSRNAVHRSNLWAAAVYRQSSNAR